MDHSASNAELNLNETCGFCKAPSSDMVKVPSMRLQKHFPAPTELASTIAGNSRITNHENEIFVACIRDSLSIHGFTIVSLVCQDSCSYDS